MASKKRGRRSSERRPLLTEPAQSLRAGSIARSVAERGNTTGGLAPPRHNDRYDFWCDGCDHEADATYLNRRWRIGSYSARCPGGSECLALLAKQFGCKPNRLLTDPRPYLPDDGASRRSDRVDPLPTEAQVSGWAEGLQIRPAQLDWWIDERGWDEDMLARYRIGWDTEAQAYTIPLYDHRGRLVNLIRRRPGGKAYGLAGRGKKNGGVRLYPRPPLRRWEWVLLCGGLLDAPLAVRHGLPAVTGSHGVGVWMQSWDRYFCDRVVVICFDVGEAAATGRRAVHLRGVGAKRVIVADLAAAGLGDGEDLTDWFVKYDRSAKDLLGLIRRGSRVVR
jgi:hypothetical protein